MDEYGAEIVQNLHFFYDAQSRPAFVEYNGTKYRYLHNLQGDIIGIVDGNGNLVVEYRYDAWGKPISITGTLKTSLGELNPFRYRVYVYDEETELYYLRSRYYNPKRNRFNNVDSIAGKVGALGAHNLFMYCANNSVLMSDPDGKEAITGGVILGTFFESLLKALLVGLLAVLGISKPSSISKPKIKLSITSPNTTTFEKSRAEQYKNSLESAVFYIACGNNFGSDLIYDENNPLNFQQTLVALGVTAAINATSNIYTSGFFQIDSNHYTNDVYDIVGRYYIDNANWGVYTKNQIAAEGLAYMLGCVNPVSEFTRGTGGYEHYHDPKHIIHIWYGVHY